MWLKTIHKQCNERYKNQYIKDNKPYPIIALNVRGSKTNYYVNCYIKYESNSPWVQIDPPLEMDKIRKELIDEFQSTN